MIEWIGPYPLEHDRKRYADDITLQELVRLRVENDKLKQRIETLQDVVRENHDSTLEIFKERERLREALSEIVGTSLACPEVMVEKARAALKGDE